MTALNWLKANNPLFKDIQIVQILVVTALMSTTQNELTDNTTPPNSHTYNLENAFGNADDYISPNSEIFQPNSEEINSDTSANSNTEILNEEEIEDLFTEHRSPASETCLQSVIPEYPVIMGEDDANNYSTRREVCNIALGENEVPSIVSKG